MLRTLGGLRGPVGLYLGLAVFSVAGTCLSQATRLNPEPIARPTAVLTLLVGCWASFSGVLAADRRRGASAIAFVFVLGLVVEMVGLKTGLPFGRYRYTREWWPVLDLPGIGNFPLQLPLAWLLVGGSSYLCVAGLKHDLWIAAFIATIVDQFMEPAMSGPLRYWIWVDHGPFAGATPWQNAAAWFAVSLAAAAGMKWILNSKTGSRGSARVVLAAHTCMVVCIAWIRML